MGKQDLVVTMAMIEAGLAEMPFSTRRRVTTAMLTRVYNAMRAADQKRCIEQMIEENG